jgi:hypothetical protein
LSILIEALLDVARDGEHVAEIADGYALPQVNGELEAVGPIQGRDLAHRPGAEASTGPIGRARIQRYPEHGHVVLTQRRTSSRYGAFMKVLMPA